MHLLPALPDPNLLAPSRWLPLSDMAAGQLASIWLNEDPQHRHAQCLALLAAEKSLALWSAAHAGLASHETAQLADWLDRESLRLFQTPQPDKVHETLDAADAASHPAADNVEVHDWLYTLAKRLARLAELEHLESEFQSRLQNEKLRSLKEFAYGASHELNNPLANISTRAQTLLREETHPERRRKLATINSQAFRAHEMISNLMLFAHPPPLKPEGVELAPIIQRVIMELTEAASAQQVQLRTQLPSEPLHLYADPEHLAVAIRSLAFNAMEALAPGGQVRILASLAGDEVEIRVEDDGPGIPPDVAPHIFDPFYSGREAGRGLGLGLSKCWRIVTLHGGRIECHAEVGDWRTTGATFVVRLPQRI